MPGRPPPTISGMSEDTGGPETPDDEGAWAELTDEVLALGGRLRQTYTEAADGKGPTEEEIRQALSTLGRAWNHLAGAFGVAIQDREVRQHLKSAAGSLAERGLRHTRRAHSPGVAGRWERPSTGER